MRIVRWQNGMVLTKSQNGDTLVEVLIAITVVSMVLVAAYVTTSRNLGTLQDTQEHSQALQLAQTQLEILHNSSSLSTFPAHSCFKNDGSGAIVNGTNCKVDAGGTPTPNQPQFTIDITNPSGTNFTIAVSWPSIHPGETDNVTLFYQP